MNKLLIELYLENKMLLELAKEHYAWIVESVNTSDGLRWWVCLWGDSPDGSIEDYWAQDASRFVAIKKVYEQFKERENCKEYRRMG